MGRFTCIRCKRIYYSKRFFWEPDREISSDNEQNPAESAKVCKAEAACGAKEEAERLQQEANEAPYCARDEKGEVDRQRVREEALFLPKGVDGVSVLVQIGDGKFQVDTSKFDNQSLEFQSRKSRRLRAGVGIGVPHGGIIQGRDDDICWIMVASMEADAAETSAAHEIQPEACNEHVDLSDVESRQERYRRDAAPRSDADADNLDSQHEGARSIDLSVGLRGKVAEADVVRASGTLSNIIGSAAPILHGPLAPLSAVGGAVGAYAGAAQLQEGLSTPSGVVDPHLVAKGAVTAGVGSSCMALGAGAAVFPGLFFPALALGVAGLGVATTVDATMDGLCEDCREGGSADICDEGTSSFSLRDQKHDALRDQMFRDFDLLDVLVSPQGHRLRGAEAENGEPVFLCITCGAWAASKPRGLLRPCQGRPPEQSSGAMALARVVDRRHPNMSKTTKLGELHSLVDLANEAVSQLDSLLGAAWERQGKAADSAACPKVATIEA